MVTVNIDKELYLSTKKFVETDKIEYPSIQNFIEKAVRDKLRIELISQKEQQK